MAEPTKWVTETEAGHSQRYIARFRDLAAQGADLAGEARLVDAMVKPGSRVLDAGCGTGRVGAAIAERGHAVTGVDADPELIAAAIEDYPRSSWLVADLTELALPGQQFDAIVVAGNVMAFMADGTQARALARLGEHLADDGFIVVGFGTGRGYPIEQFDHDIAAAALFAEQRFATWDLRPWTRDSDFSVSVLRKAQP